VPGTFVVCPSVLVTARSACGVSVSLSVAVLLALDGSTMPAGAATAAVLVKVPVAPGLIVALTVKVTVPLASTLIDVLMLPLPLAGQLEPAEALHVQLTPVKVAGNVSVTVAPVTAFGPLLVTVIV